MNDEVNHPTHYKEEGKTECIDYIKERMTEDEFRGYLYGNVLKYNHRWKYKGGVKDLAKSRWYTDRLIQEALNESTIEEVQQMQRN